MSSPEHPIHPVHPISSSGKPAGQQRPWRVRRIDANPQAAVPSRLQKTPQSRSSHDGLIRLGVLTYVCALLLIAAFSIAFHFITDNIVHRQETTARIVNISGRQRMLSQRIARLSLERAAHTSFRPEGETEAALNDAIALMESSHKAIRFGSAAQRIQAPSAGQVLAVYEAEPYRLDARLADFLLHAHALANRPPAVLSLDDPDLLAVEAAAQEPLLTALNAATVAVTSTSEAAIAHLRRVLALLTLLMLVVLLLEALFLYRPLFRRLGRAHAELLLIGRTDPLTGCLNRRAFTLEAARMLAESRVAGHPLTVLMFDIDRFKSINDRFGHPAGDKVINAVVDTLIHGTRQGNILCRMGGEEFAVLLRDCTPTEASLAADNLREAVAATPVPLAGEAGIFPVSVTTSVGVASILPTDDTIFPALSRADKALYRAKRNGRNRVETEHPAAIAEPTQALA